jgi:hypothetical protein
LAWSPLSAATICRTWAARSSVHITLDLIQPNSFLSLAGHKRLQRDDHSRIGQAALDRCRQNDIRCP